MTDSQQREAARQFFYRWNGKGKEDEHARSYWIELLSDVFGVERVTERVEFEKKVAGEKSKKRIDVYIPETHVVIEQKSLGIPLDKPQPGHDNKTPYEQAKEYDNLLPYAEKARWIITSNFAEVWIYDMSVMQPEPVKLTLADLQTKYHLLDFLVNKKQNKITEEVELSKAAGELVGKIRDCFLSQYNDPLSPKTQKSLNVLCVRLVFCFYAEDAGLFGPKDAFSRYILQYKPTDIRGKLIELFRVLDRPVSDRADMYLDDELAAFPYVNGGLFSDENIVIPRLTQEIKDALQEAARFDWSKISPTIFGAVFESTLNPETRRAGGMHYTSIENIHKVIDPLFLDDLRTELKNIRNISVLATQKKRLNAFQNKLSSIIIFDPACGSGNFLTETYLSLRRIENEVLRLKVQADSKLFDGQITFGFDQDSPIKVSIHQFYGIEINDFAVAVAKTALWIAEAQTMRETEDIIHTQMDFFPLRDYQGITEENALRIDWASVCPPEKLSYIIGNPPFSGFKTQKQAQRRDIEIVASGKVERYGLLDYVCGWYIKAADFIQATNVRCAYVSTNSITQGEQPALLWKYLFSKNIEIDYAYRTFVWDSESSQKASVHCVIIGFSVKKSAGLKNKAIFTDDGKKTPASNINPYLIDCEDILVTAKKKPICNVPKMIAGNKTVKTLALIMSQKEMDDFIIREPSSRKWFKRMIGSAEFINNIPRYCLWLVGITPKELKSMPLVMERVEQVRRDRLASADKQAHSLAETPTTFRDTNNPDHALVVPLVSSERRRYIPIGYIDKTVIANNKVSIIPDGTIYQFGILTSNVHNSWMRCVAMRMKSDYSYSLTIVYNTFPWPDPTPEQRQKIEQTAQGILDARSIYPDSSLADLYDPLTMPPELRKAHQANDIAVMQAYGMPIKETNEAACVAWLMRLYQEKVQATSK